MTISSESFMKFGPSKWFRSWKLKLKSNQVMKNAMFLLNQLIKLFESNFDKWISMNEKSVKAVENISELSDFHTYSVDIKWLKNIYDKWISMNEKPFVKLKFWGKKKSQPKIETCISLWMLLLMRYKLLSCIAAHLVVKLIFSFQFLLI